MKDISTARDAIQPLTFFSHFPNSPLIRNPISGGKSEVKLLGLSTFQICLSLHRVDFIDINCLAVSENAHDNSKPNGDFGGSDSHDEEHENLS